MKNLGKILLVVVGSIASHASANMLECRLESDDHVQRVNIVTVKNGELEVFRSRDFDNPEKARAAQNLCAAYAGAFTFHYHVIKNKWLWDRKGYEIYENGNAVTSELFSSVDAAIEDASEMIWKRLKFALKNKATIKRPDRGQMFQCRFHNLSGNGLELLILGNDGVAELTLTKIPLSGAAQQNRLYETCDTFVKRFTIASETATSLSGTEHRIFVLKDGNKDYWNFDYRTLHEALKRGAQIIEQEVHRATQLTF